MVNLFLFTPRNLVSFKHSDLKLIKNLSYSFIVKEVQRMNVKVPVMSLFAAAYATQCGTEQLCNWKTLALLLQCFYVKLLWVTGTKKNLKGFFFTASSPFGLLRI